MQTKCARCKAHLEIECPLCYMAQIKGRFYCLECFYKEKFKEDINTNENTGGLQKH